MKPRKLIQHGVSSLTVALPKPWLDARSLEKGDVVFVSEEGDSLILSAHAKTTKQSAQISVDGLDRTSMLLNCQSLYRYGYDEIVVHFKRSSTHHYRKQHDVPVSTVIHEIVNRMIGAEVIEQSTDKIVIKYLALESTEDFRAVLRRIFLLIQNTAQLLVDGMAAGDGAALRSIEDQHDTINKFVSYALRLLNKHGYPDVKKTCFYFHIIASLDKIVDIFKYIARAGSHVPITKATRSIWTRVNTSLALYAKLFYKYELETVRALSENRDETKRELQAVLPGLKPEAVLVLAQMQQVQELLLDLTDFRFALEQ